MHYGEPPEALGARKKFARFTQPMQKLVKGTRLDPGYQLDANTRFASRRAGNFQRLVEETKMNEREKILARIARH